MIVPSSHNNHSVISDCRDITQPQVERCIQKALPHMKKLFDVIYKVREFYSYCKIILPGKFALNMMDGC